MPRRLNDGFLFPTNLHYSQTAGAVEQFVNGFLFPTNLHYSQTRRWVLKVLESFYSLRIYTTLKLPSPCRGKPRCFYSLRIYTTLKLVRYAYHTL